MKNIYKQLIYLCSFSLCYLFNISACAMDVYRSIDHEGKTRFDHLPPSDKTYDVITHKTPTFSYDKINNSKPSHDVGVDAPGETNKNYQSRLEQLEASRYKACQQAKKNKHILLNNIRVIIKLDNGEEKELGHEEKMNKLEIMDKNIKQFCNTQDSSNN